MGKGKDGCDSATPMNDLLGVSLAEAITKAAKKERVSMPEPPTRFGSRGDRFWENEDGKKHNTDGPAVIKSDGTKEWWINGKRHREDGPAVEHNDGSYEWWVDGRLHCDQGPAVEHASGLREWFKNGSLHRDDGPAVEWEDGDKEWWLDGDELSESEWKTRTGR